MFINLHQHSTFSLLDGCALIEPLIDKAASLGMPALALTDHGTLSGSLKFYKACKAKGINPIIGVEMYLDDNRIEKSKNYKHIILLAKDLEGYKNLLYIVSEAHVKGFYYRPKTTTEIIFNNSEGLIVSTACLSGFLNLPEKEALIIAKKWKDKFKDDFYIELIANELASQKILNNKLLKIAGELDIKPIITLDSHYVNPEDVEIQDFILAVRNKETISKSKRYDARCLYLMGEKELYKWTNTLKYGFSKPFFSKLVSNTVEIANKCKLEIPFGKTHIPKMGMSSQGFRDLVITNAKSKGIFKKDNYKSRLKEELRVIEKLGFHDYFLIVKDIVDWSRKNGVFVGPARGSVAGSLIAFTLDITKIDPIKHGLLFERFLNENRVDMPDIDLDFDNNKREKVFEYIKNKYGKNKVARVITFGSFGKVGAIRDIGRVYQLPIKPINEISDAIYKTGGLKEAYISLSGLLKDFWKKHKKYIDFADKVSELIRHIGVHPCGTIVAPRAVYNYCPLQRAKGEIVSAYTEGEDRRELSDLGLVKLDILGLKTCSIISDTVNFIKETEKKDITEKIWNLNLADEKLIKEAQAGNTMGAFQFETESATSLIRKIKPKNFEEIAALNAINRPGPLGSGAIERFQHYEGMGIENVKLEKILEETRGVLVYQEQVMKIFNQVAGYTLVEADKLRKLAAHKLWKEGDVQNLKKDFIKRVTLKLGYEQAIELWKILREFTKYSFNKSHAVSYTYLFFQILYLKNYYPKEFFASILTNTSLGIIKDRKAGSEKNKIYQYINEARKYNVKILPPDINKSNIGFTIVKEGIRYGLAKLKGVKDATVEEIIKARPFDSFNDYLNKAKGAPSYVGKVVPLIESGAFDNIENRNTAKRIYNSVKKKEIFDLKQSYLKDSLKAFGFILEHPFLNEEVKKYLQGRYCVPSNQLKNFNRWESVGIAGLVIEFKAAMGGKSAGVIKLQDHRGDMFIYLDKTAISKYLEIIKDLNILIIKGKLMGGNRIICYADKDGRIADITNSVYELSGGDKWKEIKKTLI
jgi:DNA polymerase-3 subunit alpha